MFGELMRVGMLKFLLVLTLYIHLKDLGNSKWLLGHSHLGNSSTRGLCKGEDCESASACQ